jgi:Ca-activated chloride channel family protein
MPRRPLRLRLLLAAPLLLIGLAARADAPEDERRRPARAYSFDAEFAPVAAAPEMGATPGGAQDITFFRSRALAGEVPHPNVLTPEGLFSEHDLPLRAGPPCPQLLCVAAEAVPSTLLVQPDVRALAQLGFSSGIDPTTFRRAPMHLVAVIDKSGSMSGAPLELVKQSLTHALDLLGPDDHLSIVLYGDRAHVYLQPTAVRERRALAAQIARIESAGSTAMEEGLRVGFDLAREHARRLGGGARVMLFTDERPNVGRTDAESFMGMARAASTAGVGMTTIGVGVQFGAELAAEIASVRGGNLFFFSDHDRMKKVFKEDFDTMVTELAYDLHLTVTPAKGLKIAGVYGIPGKALKWREDGAIELAVETIFLSRKKGAIYLAFAADGAPNLPEPVLKDKSQIASVGLRYHERGGQARAQTLAITPDAPASASVGLRRGRLLVDQATTLAKATALHHERNDQEGAYQLVHALAGVFRQSGDPQLHEERQLIERLEGTLARLSGHAGEPSAALAPPRDRVSGLPPRPR